PLDRCFYQSSALDNKQDVNGIEDDEHRCDQVHNKHCLKIDMKQVQNKVHKESHKFQCQEHLSYEDSHMHHSSNIDHIEELHDIFDNPLELTTYQINSKTYKTKKKQTYYAKIEN